MKLRVTFKTPDALFYALEDLIITDHDEEDPPDLDVSTEAGEIYDEAESVCKKFIKYGEYCIIEIDTETETARVVPVGE